MCNAMERRMCLDCCNRNSKKRERKKEDLTRQGIPEALKLLRDNPLLGTPIDFQFDYPKN